MRNNPTNNTLLRTHLLFLLTGQCTLIMATLIMATLTMATLTMATLTMATLTITLHQEASTYLNQVTMGSQHLTSSDQLAVHLMSVFHHNSTPLVL